MNERIKELAEQAEQRADKIILSEKVLKSDEDWFSVFKQQFAELIVRECANAIQTEKDTGLYNAQQMAGMTVSKTVIKDHFGVEE